MIVPVTADEARRHDLDPMVASLAAAHPSSSEALADAWTGVRQFICEAGVRPEMRSPAAAAMLLARALAACGENDLAVELTRRIPGVQPLRDGLLAGRISMEHVRYWCAGLIRPIERSDLSPGLSLLVDGRCLRDNPEYYLDFAVLPVFRRLVDSALQIFAGCATEGMILFRGWRVPCNEIRNQALNEALRCALDRQPGRRPHVVWTD